MQAQITPVDRLGLTLCLAVILHAIIVLGVVFKPEDDIKPRYNAMEIILVQQSSKVEEADILAQASLAGGGDVADKVTPATPLPPPFPDNQAEVSAPPPTERQGSTSLPEAVAEATPKEIEAIEQISVESTTAEVAQERIEAHETTKAKQKEPAKPERPRPSATALLSNSFKIAALSAEIKRKLEARAERPKRKFISASTQAYKYAAYMEAWRAKVERVGNLNYPDDARSRNISGSLILDVALNPDGGINQITIRRSSGHKILDDAAIRIVKLAAPYAPFPQTFRAETDILHITRTWQFLNNRGFR